MNIIVSSLDSPSKKPKKVSDANYIEVEEIKTDIETYQLPQEIDLQPILQPGPISRVGKVIGQEKVTTRSPQSKKVKSITTEQKPVNLNKYKVAPASSGVGKLIKHLKKTRLEADQYHEMLTSRTKKRNVPLDSN